MHERALPPPLERAVLVCGYADGECECLFSASVNELCMSACISRDETTAACVSYCAP